MITRNDNGSIYGDEFKGLSTDEKPQSDVAINSIFFELDTGDFYYLKSQATSSTPAVWEKIGSGGDEPSGELLFDGDVTTIGNGGLYDYQFVPTLNIAYTSLIVELNGTKYTLNKNDGELSFGAVAGDFSSIDFSEYPFSLWMGVLDATITFLLTETAGTYSLKIWANSDPIEGDGELI